ncbi:cubilin homolog [Drosophila grimshawi]|uniref:GH12407 n=1 Tax=Drosophila grimshawi TaxID=7222 RepID=B4JIX6_DROGR|nr:cubilin homolog [Drosophila grimshawi]EDV99540.1 GH12407 [Drosophila grimshawi]
MLSGTRRFLLLLGILCPVHSFVNSPKIISKDGNLIFESGANRNISFRLSGNSRLIINEEYDVLQLLMPISGSKKRLSGDVKDEWSGPDDFLDLQGLADQLVDFKSQAFGVNGLNWTLLQIANRTRYLVVLRRRLTNVDLKLRNLKAKLKLNNCRSNPCKNGGSCVNSYNGYRCQCRPSFVGTTCEKDVNECALFNGTDLGCQNGGQCVNQFGSFACLCSPSWHGMHCSQRKADCASASAWELCGHGSCVSSSDALGYNCICDDGWRSNGLTPSCTEDVDECSATAHTPCSTKCINLPGSFTCAPCAPGLTGNGVSCRDINECETDNGGCSLRPRVECINSYGSSHCGECPIGWTGDGRTCQRTSNIDSPVGAVGLTSCMQRASLCHPAAICSEISNTIICSCPRGMVGSGYGDNGCLHGTNTNCNDMPCLNGGICMDNGPSNFTCDCPRGFHGRLCDPLPNPCTSKPCKNDGRCIPIPETDGFLCQCQPGYQGRLCDVRFSSCNELLTGMSGRLGYPPMGNRYDHNAQCVWVISTNESLVLNVTFHSFYVEDSTECRFDWLQIHDGRSTASRLIGRYCGNTLPNHGNIISSSNKLYLWFRSDNSTAHEGFNLTWQSIPPPCGGLVKFETHGTIASPGSPGNYPRNRDCRWHLVAPSSKRIKLTFFSLQLEKHDSCNFDFVSIRDAISDRELHKFCSSEHPAPLLLPTHEAMIRFHSDETDSDLGFQLHYSAEERLPGCGGVYTSKEASIRSPIYALSAGPISCEYEIRLALGESISIDFITFSLASDACVELYDVVNTDNVQGDFNMLQMKYCGGTISIPPSFHSLYNHVRIKFYTTSLPVTTIDSFELRYHMDCSHTYDAESGAIKSPGYPNQTSSARVCTYKILTAPNTVIALKRMDFQLLDDTIKSSNEDNDEPENSATDDCVSGTSLIINDGLNRAILGPYCGNKLPDDEYISQTNMLVIHLQMQSVSRGRGFHFEYSAVPVSANKCGGVHTKEGQNIRLPGDAEGKYQNDLTCYWVIVAPPSKVIMLHWLSFDLEDSSGCSYDYVEVYEDAIVVGNNKAPPLARYCDQMPLDMTAHVHIMTIKFVSDYSHAGAGFELSYRFVDPNSCGGHIHGSTGRLISPGYPLNYTNGLDCIWQLSATHGGQLELQLDLFELTATPNCNGDWLEVRNGGSNRSALIGRFCGTSVPRQIPSFTHELYLHFHTDDVGTARGFRLAWRTFGSGCGGRLTGSAGVITSPNYPNAYPHNAHCEWHLRVHTGSSIRLVIEDLEMERTHDYCDMDYLRIYNGDSSSRFLDFTYQTLCSMPDDDKRDLHIDSNEVVVVFHSDFSNAERGFRISYSADCQQVKLNSIQGVIESLNYGEAFFASSINCSWHLQSPRGNKIKLEVSHFDHRSSRLPTDGADGGLYLLDGGVVVPIVHLGMHNVSGDTLTIIHNTSSISFRLEYRVDGCVKELKDDRGFFHSPKHPLMYPNDVECYWLIHAPFGQVIELTVLDMDIEDSANCTKDALVISNSFQEAGVHERHCGSNPKLILTSAGHKLHVRFITDVSHNGRGFEASYRIMKSSCGGKVSSKSGTITSPEYPKPYPRNSNCEWLLEVAPHHTIIFDMQDVDIEPSFRCSWDYVAAYDMSASDSLDDNEGHQIFKLCHGNDQELAIRKSVTNRAIVRFVTDNSIQHRGFRLQYRESCGQTLSIDETDFENLSLSSQVARNETCVWVLQATDPSKHIIFTPTHIMLHAEPLSRYSSETDCKTNGIKIYEGITATGTPRQQFCRTHPPAIISRGLALTISLPMLLVSEFEGHYMTMDTACGSTYNAVSGRFSSPNYPDSYPVNIECEWVLEASAGNSLALIVESLDLEQSDGCNNDYLELREQSQRGSLIGVYCGNEVPAAISSKGSIWIKFKSSNDDVGAGFLANYHYEYHNELNGTGGRIESPHYPSTFESNEPYSWRITVDTDYVVLVNVVYLLDVNHPHVRFYDGYTDIGGQLEPQPYKPLVSNTNILYITATRGPFQLNWERLSKEALASNRSAELQTRQCGQQLMTLNSSLIYFSSPGYPQGYAPNLHCSWILVPASPAMHAALRLITVDLELFTDACYADYVVISSSSDMQHWTELAKICAQANVTSGLYHGKPYLRLEFVTDVSVNKTGFSSMVRTICGSELTASRGLVNITQLASNNVECVWTIRVRQGKRIRITFPESQLSASGQGNDLTQCRNFFVVRNGYAEDSPFLQHGKYCENNITDVLETSSNRAYIKFQRNSFSRFRASFHYEEISDACSGHILLDDGSYNNTTRLISSPNFPNLPNPHSECVWRISAPPQHRIAVEFLSFDLTPSRSEPSNQSNDESDDGCDREFVQINDGSTELSPQLGRFCGARKPDTAFSSGSELRIKFYTGVLESRPGFQARIKLADCGGSYYSANGVIRSPIPSQLDMHLLTSKLKECIYTIEAERGSTIDLTFVGMHLPMPENGNCSGRTHLQLEEMEPFGNENEQRISDSLQLCGTDNRNLQVETNKIVVRLRMPTGHLGTEESFQLKYTARGSGCGQTIFGEQGRLQTPNYPKEVTKPMHCIWRIQVAKGRRVKVEILDFDVGGSLANRTHSGFRGRIVFTNDHKLYSVIGRYGNDPPAEVISTDNTMAIDVFLMPSHRGFKLRFSAYGESECMDVRASMLFERSNTSMVHCSYKLRPPANSTMMLQVRRYNTSSTFMSNIHICGALAPLKLLLVDETEPLLPMLFCDVEPAASSVETNRTVRLPFPVEMIVTGDRKNGMNLLELSYSVQHCGGIVPLELGDNLTITQPRNLPARVTVDCAWVVGPDPDAEDPLSPQDIQLEVSVAVNLDGDCKLHYLKLYSGPNQNSPLLGPYCNQATVINLVVERGLFLEYHAASTTNAQHNATFNVTVKYGSGCGGRLTYPYRLIDLREQYKNNVECIWEIEAEPGFHIGLTFLNRFYIENSHGCDKDYLRVQQRNSTDDSWIDLQTLCGRSPPDNINSTSAEMRLIFRSNSDITGDGFTARFDRNCGGLLYATAEPQLLSSPGYPKGYGKNIYCNYTFSPLDERAPGVLVSFLEFNLEPSPPNSCMYDNVTVTTRDKGDSMQESVICGVKQRHAYRAQRSISLLLRSDNTFFGRGFQLEYSTSLCGGVISTSQPVESPRQHQDNQMPPNSDCYWNLTAPEGHKFTVKFELLDFEAGNFLCSYDGVEVFDSPVPDEKRRMVRYCGHVTDDLPTLHISGNRALIHSYSDERDPSRGFRALVRVLPNCDERIFLGEHNSSYTFNKFIGTYANNLDCSFVFHAENGFQISVEFRSFHVEASIGCKADFLELRDGAGPFADEIGRFCGQDLPPNLSSSRKTLFMRFVSDNQISDTGFEIVVTARPLQCGNPLIKLDGKQPYEIHSPINDQGKYDNNVFCLWKIVSEISIHLKFISLDLEATNATDSCDSDYIKIYNSEDAQVVEHGYGSAVIFNGQKNTHSFLDYATEHVYCGNSLPDDYYPNSKNVYIKFRTNEAVTRTGFHIRVVPDLSCQYTYGGYQGRIKISETIDCDATIVAPVNHTLSIYYAEVIFGSSDCDVEYVEVFDMANNKSLQRTCAYLNAGKSIFTTTNQLRLHFKTGSILNNFDMTYIATPIENGPGCGGQLYNTEGIFSNPFYPQNVRNNSVCRWSVRVPSNTHVLLNIEFFDLGSKATCHTDYLLIQEKRDDGAMQERRRFCGEDKPRIYLSQRSQLYVEFHKSVNYDGIGWVIKFTGVYSDYQIQPYMLE